MHYLPIHTGFIHYISLFAYPHRALLSTFHNAILSFTGLKAYPVNCWTISMCHGQR